MVSFQLANRFRAEHRDNSQMSELSPGAWYTKGQSALEKAYRRLQKARDVQSRCTEG